MKFYSRVIKFEDGMTIEMRIGGHPVMLDKEDYEVALNLAENEISERARLNGINRLWQDSFHFEEDDYDFE